MSLDLTLLVNPAAGRGTRPDVTEQVQERLQRAGFAVRRLVAPDAVGSARLADEAVRAGTGALVVVGGDGMVHLAVQALAGTGVPLGIVPTGSGNDFARALGVPMRDPVAAADVVIGHRVRTVDLGHVGDVYFATVLAAGFDARVNERAERARWPRGRGRYEAAVMAELRVFEPLSYTLESGTRRWPAEAMLVAVGNTPSYGGGLRLCPGADPADGLLDLVVIRPLSKLGLLRVFPRLYRGTHVAHPAYEHHLVRAVSIAAPRVTAYADGERLAALPLTVECAPGALRVFVPAADVRTAR